MNREKAIVTYTEDGTISPQFITELTSRLPFLNLTFTNPLISESHKLSRLEIDLIRFSPEIFPKFAPGAIKNNIIFAHLFLVTVDDLETYRSSTRKAIQEWISVVANKKNNEWMIIYAAPKPKSNRLFSIGASLTVYEKLKVDFNLKKDQFFHVEVNNTESKNVEAWNELVSGLKSAVLAAISSQITQYEDDARRLEQQRLIPGWNYCQYFILKEALSFTFELLTLYDVALLHYDELEATFFQTLEEQGAPWFKKFGATDEKDDNFDLFAISKKPYRESIIQNSISIFDFRIYLFTRQCSLLMLLKKPIDICKRTKTFVSSLSRSLLDYSGSLTRHFRESWIFSISLNIVHHCDELAAFCDYNTASLASYRALKGDLLLFSRVQLDKLGVAAKLLSHSIHCGSLKIDNGDGSFDIASFDNSRIITSNKLLESYLKSKPAFDAAYEDVTFKCIRSYDACNRQAALSYLKADLAFLYFIRQNYSKASELFSEICFRYSENGWNQIDAVLIERYAICQRQLKRNDNLVRCYLHLVRFPEYLELESHSFYLKELKNCCQDSPLEVLTRNCSLFFLNNIQLVDGLNGEPLLAKINLENNLPTDFHFDSIVLNLSTIDGMEMLLALENFTLVPGTNFVNLLCDKSTVPGEYSPVSLIVKRGRMVFQYDIIPKFQKSCKITVYESDKSVVFGLNLSQDENQILFVQINTNSNKIIGGVLEITPLSSAFYDLPLKMPLFVTKNDKTASLLLTTTKNLISSLDIDKDSVLKFQLPFKVNEANSIHHKFKITLTELLDNGKKILYSKTLSFQVGLHLNIKHTLSHTAASTMIKYRLSGTDNYPIRIIAAETFPVDIKSLVSKLPRILFPLQSISLISTLPAELASDAFIKLKISYRKTIDEIKHYLSETLSKQFNDNGVPDAIWRLKKAVLGFITSKVNPIELSYYGILALPHIPNNIIDPHLMHLTHAQKTAVWSSILAVNQKLEVISEADIIDACEFLEVDCLNSQISVAPCKILLKGHWTLEKKGWLNVGEIARCKLVLSAIHWKGEIEKLGVSISVKYDRKDFAIGGKSIMHASLTKNVNHLEFPLAISPLNAGPLQLPGVTFECSMSASEGVFIKGPSGTSFISVKPREESCLRYLKEGE